MKRQYTKRRKWKINEIKKLKFLFLNTSLSNIEISKKLNRTEASMERQLYKKLKLKKPKKLLKKLKSESAKGKINLLKKNGQWKGNKVGYTALHDWVKNHKTKPKFCEKCGTKSPYDLANISGKYKRDINDFKWVCRRCHRQLHAERKVLCSSI